MKRRGQEHRRDTPEEEDWGCSVQNPCTEQVSLTCLVFKKKKITLEITLIEQAKIRS